VVVGVSIFSLIILNLNLLYYKMAINQMKIKDAKITIKLLSKTFDDFKIVMETVQILSLNTTSY